MRKTTKTPAKTKEVEVKTAEVKEAATKVVEETAKVAEKAAKAAGKAAKAVTEKVGEVKKEAALTQTKKTPARKVKEQVYLQYLGKEIDKDDLVKQVKEIWVKDLKKKASQMKTLTLYLKPEENKAYYVINGEETGSLEL